MTHEGARARRRRIAAEEEAWAEQAWQEYRQTPEGSQVCRVIRISNHAPPPPEREPREPLRHVDVSGPRSLVPRGTMRA